MIMYRRTALAVTLCAAGLSLAACSAGITTANSGKSSSPTASRTAPSPKATPSRAASPARSPSTSTSPSQASTVSLPAPADSFPLAPGAQVLANQSCPKQISVMLGPVKPSQASAFYTRALPRAGYSITSNMLTSDPDNGAPDGMLMLDFTGHGYTGTLIGADNLSSAASAGPSTGSFSGALSKNVVEIVMFSDGTPETYQCPSD